MKPMVIVAECPQKEQETLAVYFCVEFTVPLTTECEITVSTVPYRHHDQLIGKSNRIILESTGKMAVYFCDSIWCSSHH